MTNLTFSADDLRQLATAALANHDIDGAVALIDNANDTEKAIKNEQSQIQESCQEGGTAD